MALTKLKTQTLSTFTQPPLESTVMVGMYSGIDWLRTGIHVYIQEGGVYEVVNISGNVYTLKLRTAEASPGTAVTTGVIYPVEYQAAYDWGAKEW